MHGLLHNCVYFPLVLSPALQHPMLQHQHKCHGFVAFVFLSLFHCYHSTQHSIQGRPLPKLRWLLVRHALVGRTPQGKGSAEVCMCRRAGAHVIHGAETLQQEFVHLECARRQPTREPGVLLDLLHADAALWVRHQHARQHIQAVRTHSWVLRQAQAQFSWRSAHMCTHVALLTG